MTPIFFDIYTGRMFEAALWGLVFALLAIVAIWAVIELTTWVFPSLKGRFGKHLDRKSFPKFMRNRHAN